MSCFATCAEEVLSAERTELPHVTVSAMQRILGNIPWAPNCEKRIRRKRSRGDGSFPWRRMLLGEGSWERSNPGREKLRGKCSQKHKAPRCFAPRSHELRREGSSREHFFSPELMAPMRPLLLDISYEEISGKRTSPGRNCPGEQVSVETVRIASF